MLDANSSGYHTSLGNYFGDPLQAFQDNVIELNGFTLTNCAFDNLDIL